MCEIKKGDVVYLVKGGNVMFEDGRLYRMSDCKLKGGKIVLGMKGVAEKKVEKKEGISLLKQDSIDLGDFKLESMEIELPKEEMPERNDFGGWVGPVLMLGAGFLWMLKKISGFDRKINFNSCELRHQEAIVRIAKLEGKVLRKQLIDGGKKVKEKMEKKEKD